MRLKIWFLATRPWSFVMTLVSSGLAGAFALMHGVFDLSLFLVTTIGLILFHAVSNIVNDYYDYKHTVDRPGAPTTRYRPHPLVTGEISLRDIQVEISILYALILLIALYLSFIRGFMVLLFTIAGLFFSYFYTAEPLILKHKALGELAVLLSWGPLMTGGAYFVLTGRLDPLVITSSIPHGILVMAVLFANNMRDIDYDREAGIKTIPIILGLRKSLVMFQYMILSAFLIVIILVSIRYLPITSLLTLITSLDAYKLIKTFRKEIPDAADPMTAQLTLKFGVLLIIGIIISAYINIPI